MLCLQQCDCKKSDVIPTPQPTPEVLPPITTTGANTFGCYVDGKLWLPFGGVTYPDLVGTYGSGHIYIYADRNHINEVNSTFTIEINKGVYAKGMYNLSFKNSLEGNSWYAYYIYNGLPDSNRYFVDTVNTGTLNLLRLDTISFIMSGTFQFNGYNKYLNKTVKITDGRFDIRYK